MISLSIPGAPEDSRTWRFSLTFSLALHVLILAGLTAWGITKAFQATTGRVYAGSAPAMEYAGSINGLPGEGVVDPVANIVESLPQRIKAAADMTPAQRAAAITDGKAGLSAVSESSLVEIADLFKIEDRAYEPVLPPPKGPFDMDSQIPYDVKTAAEGGYIIVLLDKDGRICEVACPADEATDDLRAASDIFKMMEMMPALRKVYMRMMVPLMPQITEQEKQHDHK